MLKAKHRFFSFVAAAMLALGFVLLSGCAAGGDGASACACETQGKFGTRLEPVWQLYDDGTQALDSQRRWDTERKEYCSFTQTATGAFCLPDFVYAHEGWYSDPACAKPVAIVATCAKLPRYMRDDTSKPYDTCEPRALEKLFSLGEPLPVGVDLYKLDLGVCSAASKTDTANSAMPIGVPVPMSAFASAAVSPQAL